MSGDILFLAHRIPFPPDRGDKIRSHHVLRHLAGIASVHVGCLVDDEAELAHEPLLVELAASHCVVPRTKPLWRAGLEALARGKPVSLTAFDHSRLCDYVRRTVAEHEIATIHVFSGQMGQYVPEDFRGQVVVDLGDVDSAKFEAYAQASPLPLRLIHAREARLMRREEQRLAERADQTLFVSDAEAALFLSRLRGSKPVRVGALPNGIDTAYFDPEALTGQAPFAGTAGPHIVFTGQMDYPPNIAAAERIALRLMPMIARRFSGAQCHIVGRNLTAAVLRLDGRDGCRVWGAVPDVRPYLAGADLVMVPLDIARGVQNKVLEAMAMARAVVLSPDAATGIAAQDGRDFTIGLDDAGLAAKAIALLESPQEIAAMGHAARKYVLAHHRWEQVLAPLAAIEGLAGAPTEHGLAAA